MHVYIRDVILMCIVLVTTPAPTTTVLTTTVVLEEGSSGSLSAMVAGHPTSVHGIACALLIAAIGKLQPPVTHDTTMSHFTQLCVWF